MTRYDDIPLAFRGIADALSKLTEQYAPLLRALSQPTPARSERVRRMRAAYGQRRGHR